MREAVGLCLCADQLSAAAAPWDVTPVLTRLQAWRRLVLPAPDPTMTDDVYIDLVTRWVGLL